jgi:hypothetical protein
MRRMIRQSICCHPFLCLPFIPRRRSPLEQREPKPHEKQQTGDPSRSVESRGQQLAHLRCPYPLGGTTPASWFLQRAR